MNVGATAITIFHSPPDPERFSLWVVGYLAAASDAAGYISARRSIQGSNQLDWALEVSFDSAEHLDDAFLDSVERQAIIRGGEAQGFGRCASDLILDDSQPPPANTGIFLHSVTPGKEAEFEAAERYLTETSSDFPGYEGTIVFPADASGHWMSVLRFRTAQQLTEWVGSIAGTSRSVATFTRQTDS